MDPSTIEKKAGRPADPCAMVIFGASCDLTKRKLIPALYNLAKDNLLSNCRAMIRKWQGFVLIDYLFKGRHFDRQIIVL